MPDNRSIVKELAGLFTDMTRDIISVDEIEADIVERYGQVKAVLPGKGHSLIVQWADGTAHRITVEDFGG